jgi:hypothetical protein
MDVFGGHLAGSRNGEWNVVSCEWRMMERDRADSHSQLTIFHSQLAGWAHCQLSFRCRSFATAAAIRT